MKFQSAVVLRSRYLSQENPQAGTKAAMMEHIGMLLEWRGTWKRFSSGQAGTQTFSKPAVWAVEAGWWNE